MKQYLLGMLNSEKRLKPDNRGPSHIFIHLAQTLAG